MVANRTVYVSGCIGTVLETGKLIAGGAVAEAEQALTHLKNILLASDSNLSNVVKVTIFITDFNDFDSINAVYKKCTLISSLFIDCRLSVLFTCFIFVNNKTLNLSHYFWFDSVFTGSFPARSCVQVVKLPLNASIEIEAIAATNGGEYDY